MKANNIYVHRTISIIVVCVVLLSSCQINPFSNRNPQQNLIAESTEQPLPMAEVFFAVTLPVGLKGDEDIYLSVVDEVTGIPYNYQNFLMQKGDDFHYYIAIPFHVGSIIKYRYLRQGNTSILEDNFCDQPIRYRMYYVGGPGEVMDTIYSWTDSTSSIETGRITGIIIDSVNDAGIPDILVSVGGRQTFSDSNGEFVLEGIPEGTHNLVAYSIDGRYQPFQQGAIVKSGKRTPVSINITPSNFVNVTFTVSLPPNTVPSAPIRFAGNLLQLGNSFGDLLGGMNNNYRELPVLSPLPDGRFTFSIMLPEGMDIRYKYTLGDGFWNAEHMIDGDFKTRQLIVPSSGGVVQDVVDTWQSGLNAPIIFDVTVPENTPIAEKISIQFNPYVWTEPIQMWPIGNNRWIYQLFGPFDYFDSLEYTFCRNDQCNLVLDPSDSHKPWTGIVQTSHEPQNIQDQITSWKWTSNYSYIDNQVDNGIGKDESFWTGVEFLSGQNLSWKEYAPSAIQKVQEIGSNTLVIRPTWSLLANNPVEFSLKPGVDLFGSELNSIFKSIQATDMRIAIFPTVNHQGSISDWWLDSILDNTWWDNWFSSYRAFILYYSKLAAQNNIETLILGGDWLLPALPGGTLPDGSNSNPPADSDARWISLIAEIRQQYSGQIFWAVKYPGGLVHTPVLINELDGIYLLWTAPIADSLDTSIMDMHTQAGILLDNEIAPFKATFQKPMVIAIAYPSISGSGFGCFKESQSYCKDWTLLNQPNPFIENIELNFRAQQDVYQAMFKAINERSWVDGFISRGFYVPLSLQDVSASIFGKPTITLVDHWFHSLSR